MKTRDQIAVTPSDRAIKLIRETADAEVRGPSIIRDFTYNDDRSFRVTLSCRGLEQ
jgi:hypothetical protein